MLAQQVDFFSIGTNDLIQYALAIDRVNEHVAYMYQPFHPAILRMIQQVVQAAEASNIKVSLCGEMAGDPLCTTLLMGLGLTELSMNPRAIPLIKKIIRSLSMKGARRDVKNVLRLHTVDEVRAYIVDRMSTLLPDLNAKGYLHS
jgi:phosphotransferase system enzyme I (PtsI)